MNATARWLAAAVLLAALVAGGAGFYRYQVHLERRSVETKLTAVARLRVREIVAWRQESLEKGAEVMERPHLASVLGRALTTDDPLPREEATAELRVLQRHERFADVLLVDGEGRTVVRLAASTAPHLVALRAAAEAMRLRRPVLTDVHTDAGLPPDISVVVPVLSTTGGAVRPVGAVLLVIDAAKTLYPIVRSRVMAGSSADAFLVRREGDAVVTLSQPRLAGGSALPLRIPLTRRDAPSVRGVLGETGVLEGKDFGGVDVLAVVLPVPGTSWFLVAKVDSSEVIRGVRRGALLAGGLVLAFFALAAAATVFVWQRNEKSHYQALYLAEAERRASEARYRLVTETARDVVWLYDLAAGRFRWVSPSVEKVLGFTVEELLDRSMRDVVAPGSWPLVEQRLRDRPRALASGDESTRTETNEITLLRKDGTLAETEVVSTLLEDDAGRMTQVQGVARDITERKRAEAELSGKDALLREMSAAAHIGAWDFDATTGKGAWTDEVARIHEVDPELAPTAEFGLGFYAGESRERIEAAVRAAIEEGKPYDLELELTTARGIRKWVRTVGVPVVEDGRVVRVRGSIQDVTDRVRAERERRQLAEQLVQAQKMESVGRLAGGVAHDFNNMLSVIQGHVALALEQAGPGHPLHAHLDEIRKAAQRSAVITKQLLAFARQQAAAPRTLDLNETVAGMLTMLRRLIGEEVEVLFRPGDGLWSVKVDPSQVDQLLANLCVNARDAIEGVGVVTLATGNVLVDEPFCRSRAGALPGEYVRLTVADDGCGMDKEVLDHLFEPFFTTKGPGKGTGLGLATVHGIVSQNGGFIDVRSEPGRGTGFDIYLPRSTEAPVEAPSSEATDVPAGHGEVVLLAEDEPAMLRLGTQMLERLGYRVLAADSPSKAIHMAREHEGPIDVLITDVVMPEMNGRELAARLEPLRPALRCLFISGYTADVIAHRGVLHEGVSFLQKPFTQRELALKVRAVLDPRAAGPGEGRPRVERVVYVDDEEPLVELLGRALERAGYVMRGFSDPGKALAEVRRDPAGFDAVVTDVSMPEMSGFELARAVRELRRDATVVIVSGFTDERREADARAAGADALIEKPTEAGALGEALDAFFRSLPGAAAAGDA